MQTIGKYANMPIRELLDIHRITVTDLAKQMKLNRCYVSRLLGKPLSESYENRIAEAVSEILKGRDGN